MKRHSKTIVAVLIVLSIICIVIIKRNVDNNKIARYEQIRESCQKEISNIHEMESDDYINKINVAFNYWKDEYFLSSYTKLFHDHTSLRVSLNETFEEIDPKERALKLIEYDETIRANMVEYMYRAGYETFMKRNTINYQYFKANGVEYHIDNDYSVKYCCGTNEYIISTNSMYIEHSQTGNRDIYKFSYEDGNMEEFTKYEPSNVNNCKNEKGINEDDLIKNSTKKSTSNSLSNTTTEKSHDPDDYDIDTYYEDYKDEFEDEDDAWDDFEDNEGWEDY